MYLTPRMLVFPPNCTHTTCSRERGQVRCQNLSDLQLYDTFETTNYWGTTSNECIYTGISAPLDTGMLALKEG